MFGHTARRESKTTSYRNVCLLQQRARSACTHTVSRSVHARFLLRTLVARKLRFRSNSKEVQLLVRFWRVEQHFACQNTNSISGVRNSQIRVLISKVRILRRIDVFAYDFTEFAIAHCTCAESRLCLTHAQKGYFEKSPEPMASPQHTT